jgi:hypothetical protein
MTERKTKEAREVKNEYDQKISIWNISSIMSNIFIYINRRDMLELSTVCKKWNRIVNPIIHKTIKLNCKPSVIFGYSDNDSGSDKCNAEAIKCISNNSKHAQFVKEFKYKYRLQPSRAIEFFQTFRFISNLAIYDCSMSQGQFLGMIRPLSQLQKLEISGININKDISERVNIAPVQLPTSLKKLKLGCIGLIYDPKLFIQVINSHNNLIEFSFSSYSNEIFLKPFYKPYPSLINFEYTNQPLQSPQFLIKIFEQNPQITTLKLSSRYWSSEIVNRICRYLTGLEELNLIRPPLGNNNYPGFNFKLSQPTKIKKLMLEQIKLSDFSLSSILINCPHLEELGLNFYRSYNSPNFVKFLSFCNSTKLKKLTINRNVLGESAFKALLLNCPYINELDINLPDEWKGVIKHIYEMCANLERLNIFPPYGIYGKELDAFYKEFYDSEFFTSNPKCKFTLTSLTFNLAKVQDSKAAYFKNFESLKSIKYLGQPKIDFSSFNQETRIDMALWPDYRLQITENFMTYNAELKRF